MGTRADFYIGRDSQTMEWLGSIAHDGYPEGLPRKVMPARDEQDYRQRVSAVLAVHNHATTPEQWWPWPWEDSRTTDYAYAFDEGKVWTSAFGYAWFDSIEEDAVYGTDAHDKLMFPDMSARQRVAYGPRSGLMILKVL